MKEALRKKLLSARLELDEDYRQAASIIIAQKCITKLKKTTSLAIYYPMKAEVNALLLADFAQHHGIELSLPITEYSFAKWEPGEALESVDNTLQPLTRSISQPKVIIVPLVGFDRKCNRLGYGRGFYDRALSKLPQAFKLGIAYATQECEAIPMEAHDIALDMIITEKGLYENNR